MARWLTIAVVVAGLLWGGWWVVGRQGVLRGAEAAIESARAQGWTIGYDDLSVTGFPNRFDTTLDAVSVATPEGWGLTAPFLQVFALSYRPNHIIAVAPHEMAVATPAGTAEIRSDDLRASAVVALADRALDRATVTAEALAVDARGWTLAVSSGQIALRRAGSPTTFDLAAGLSNIDPGGPLWQQLGRSVLPGRIDSFDLDAGLVLDDPLSPGNRPRPVSADLRRLGIAWEGVRLDLSGPLTFDRTGRPSGALRLRARGWDELLDMAAAMGLIPAQQLPLLAAGLGGMADGEGVLEVPVTLENGVLGIAGFPIGPVF